MEKIIRYTHKELKKYLETEDLKTLHRLKLELDDLYYNTGESILEDFKYDMLKEVLKKRDPEYSPPVGAKLREGENRTELPFWLGSLDKITPEENDVLQRWKKANPSSENLIAEKLDGVSCLLVSVPFGGGYKTFLYTRGDGVIGADISYLLPYFHSIPKNLGEISVRGELIIKKKTFEKKYKGQVINGKSYKNPRNMVAGLIGAKTSRKGLEDINFVTYEIVGNDTMPKPSKQFNTLEKMGFLVVKYEKTDSLTVETLSKFFLKYREESEYEIDGIVVYANEKYDRNTSGNPEYMFAFKMLLGDAIRETTVKSIEWNVSKWGQLKPVVIIEPLELSGVTINRATAYHGKYVEDNSLGPGAIVKITRSKEVIPYIVDVVKPADKPQMPTDYTWDKNHVNIIAGKKNAKKMEGTMCVKLISSFFAKLGIKHVSEATVKKMYDNGLNNMLKILEASKERLLEVPEFQEKSAERIYTNIHNGMKNVKLATLLGASGIFGFGIGVKRMETLLLDIPDLMEIYKQKSRDQLLTMIINVEGFSEIMGLHIVNNIKHADLLVKKMSKYMTFKEETRVSSDMTGHKYVMTGFRDKKLEEDIAQRGGKVTGTVSKNTNALIIKQKTDKLTGKLEKAHQLGVPIFSRDEFVMKFINGN
jgi:DNA ligase (NAD+)